MGGAGFTIMRYALCFFALLFVLDTFQTFVVKEAKGQIYTPDDTLSEQSENFQLFVECMTSKTASRCFQKYRRGIVQDFSQVFGTESDSSRVLSQ